MAPQERRCVGGKLRVNGGHSPTAERAWGLPEDTPPSHGPSSVQAMKMLGMTGKGLCLEMERTRWRQSLGEGSGRSLAVRGQCPVWERGL